LCSDPTVLGHANPRIDPSDFSSFLTDFDVTISKSGPAGLFDLKLEEDATFQQGETCQIIAINGCSSGAPALPVTGFENGSPVQVCDTLGATDVTVRIECDTLANGFINSVTARASSVDNAASDLSASDTMTQAQACSATTSPSISAQKICHDATA